MGSISNGRTGLEVSIQMPPEGSKTVREPMPLPVTSPIPRGTRLGTGMAVTRAAALVMSLLSMSLMVSSRQQGTLTIFGIEIPLHANWSFSYSLQFLVGMSAASAAYSLAQLLIMVAHKAVKKVSMVPSRRHMWLLFAGDQVFSLAMMSAGSAAAAVSNLNRTGIRYTALPNFCKPLPHFCNFSAASIACAFLSCVFLAASAIIDVVWLASL